ncbi:hypothetical protein T492DRAFT_253679 [Pavlovales sp. CCMP2436]|nr:hypothetical protein T492DRAFT_253679 [Pavlovales sp. CCMP2436]
MIATFTFRFIHELGGDQNGSDSSLVQTTHFDELPRYLFNGEMVAFAFLGVLGGVAGGAFVRCTRAFVLWRVATADALPWDSAEVAATCLRNCQTLGRSAARRIRVGGGGRGDDGDQSRVRLATSDAANPANRWRRAVEQTTREVSYYTN